jgi:invasion protein IalB
MQLSSKLLVALKSGKLLSVTFQSVGKDKVTLQFSLNNLADAPPRTDGAID